MVPKVILELVKILKEKYPIQLICECMGVARSSYYRWLKKGIKLITKLENKIKEICIKHKYLIGHRTVKAWLLREYSATRGSYKPYCSGKSKKIHLLLQYNTTSGKIKLPVPDRISGTGSIGVFFMSHFCGPVQIEKGSF